MTRKLLWLICAFIFLADQCFGVEKTRQKRTVASDAAKSNFELETRAQTEAFFNDLFRVQIEYFTKVKAALPANTKRVQDIDIYITRLNTAIQEPDISKKDKMWDDTFQEANRSPFLKNNEAETGLTNEAYQKVLDDSGIKDAIKRVLSDIAVYFWKMAKASGKIVGDTIEEHMENMRTGRN